MFEYKVEGFLFESKSQSEEAKKEALGVHYIKENTSMDSPQVVLKLYNRLIAQEMFRTPIGINFLCELRLMLLASSEIKQEEIQPIPIPRNRTHRETEQPKPRKNYKKAFRIAATLAVVFGISVVGMFFIIKLSKNNVNIINYRNQIIDEYQGWEKELEEKENFLKEWEAELEKQQNTTQEEP